MLQFDENVLQCFEKNPSTSTRTVGHAVDVDCYPVWNTVREQELHPLNRQKVQALLGPNDYLRQDQFIHWFVPQSTEKPNFPAMVLFKNETCFTQEGFSTAVTAMFGQKQPLILHLFTATKNALWSTIGQAFLLTFSLGLTCYPDGSMHRFTMCYWRKSYQKC